LTDKKKVGRKPRFDKSTIRAIRLNDDLYQQIPAPKTGWIEQAIREKLNHDNLRIIE